MTHGPIYGKQAGQQDHRFLHQRMESTSERLRGQSEISDRLKLIAAIFLTWVAIWTALTQLSPWNLQVTFRHLASAAGCQTARQMDLAPAVRGQAGYWPHLDADRDGVACPAKLSTAAVQTAHAGSARHTKMRKTHGKVRHGTG